MIVIHDDNSVSLVQGDCANIRYRVEGLNLCEGDIFVFRVKNKDNIKVIDKQIRRFEPNGEVVVLLDNSDTKNLVGNYKYSIQMFLKDNRVETLISNIDFNVEEGN